MKIYVSDKEIIENDLLDTERYDIVLTKYREDFWEEEIYPEIQSLEQHEAEIRKPLEEEIDKLKNINNSLSGRLDFYENIGRGGKVPHQTISEIYNEYLKMLADKEEDAKGLHNILRKQERLKVIAELEEWADENLTKLIKRGYFLPNYLRGLRLVEYEKLKQKLNEMKGDKQ